MAVFQYRGPATVEHVNLRKVPSPSGGDLVTAVDIKIKAEFPEIFAAPAVCSVLGVEDLESVGPELALWAADGAPRFLGITEVCCWAEFCGRHKIVFDWIAQIATKIGKFKFVPKDDRAAEFTFSVSIEAPSNRFVLALAEHNRESVDLVIEALPDLVEQATEDER